MVNEKITEGIVREFFKNDPLNEIIKVEEQKSKSQRINELLKTSSKSKTNNWGMPEFIITFPSQNTNYVIVIECKASLDKHESPNLDKPRDFAVDGVLHYAKFLSKDFDVIALAVSGESNEELKVSTYKWFRGQPNEVDLKEKTLLPINDYLRLFDNEVFYENIKNLDIIQKAVHLNDDFHSYSITENGRCTIVSAILLSLLDEPFKNSYSTYKKTSELAEGMLLALDRVLTRYKVRNKDSMIGEFNKILNEPIFKREKIKKNKQKEDTETIIIVKENFINYLHKNVYPLVKMEDVGYDILGKFYTEFIRYAGSSQKQGLVLTPAHITDLFCDLADIGVDDTVYDPCCGSGGFLIAAMKRMITLAGANSDKKNNIKSDQLIGVETRPDMFSYACTNMMFRGDGNANIYCDSCFSKKTHIMEQHNPNIVLLNPPYDVGNVGQMEFIEHALDVTSKNNGTVVAIVQMSCAIKNENELKNIKKRLLEKYRLKAVISMPDELFSPGVNAVTCTMVWDANKPNKGYETWFSQLKDDGFEKRKHKGRLDIKKRWSGIKDNFIKAYINSKEIAGLSIAKEVDENDEWCAEAYMETDYSTLNDDDFLSVLSDYSSFLVKNRISVGDTDEYEI